MTDVKDTPRALALAIVFGGGVLAQTPPVAPPVPRHAPPGAAAMHPGPAQSGQTPGRPDGTRTCTYRGEPVMCGPRGLKGAADRLYHHEGARFVDVTDRAGVADTARCYGFAAAWADVDDDGARDLLVVNDSTPNYLYRNRGDGTFEEIGFPSGFALNEEGREQAGATSRLPRKMMRRTRRSAIFSRRRTGAPAIPPPRGASSTKRGG